MCGSLSFFSSIACFVASVLCGRHGNFISQHNQRCPAGPPGSDPPLPTSRSPPYLHNCCSLQDSTGAPEPMTSVDLPRHASNSTTCVCWTSGAPAYLYRNLSCLYVYSALKDYLILQCALMAVACGVCAWFLVVLWQSRLQGHRPGLVTAQRKGSNKKCHRCPMVTASATYTS